MADSSIELGNILWDVASKQLRGKMPASDFQKYILSFIFLYYISDKYLNIVKKELSNEYKGYEKECSYINSKDNKSILQETKDKYNKEIEKLVEKEIKEYKKNNPDLEEEYILQERNMRLKEYLELTAGSTMTPYVLWYLKNLKDIKQFEEYIKRKTHFIIKPQYLWDNIYDMADNENSNLLEILQNGFKFIEEYSFNIVFKGLFSEVDLYSNTLGKNNAEKNIRICNIIKEIGNGLARFKKNIQNNVDILGDAYEILLEKFASNSGTKAGEYYTPQAVSSILSGIVTQDSQDPTLEIKRDIDGVLDFACGSGSLLINIKKRIDDINKKYNTHIKITQIYGQELNVVTYNLARMNMILHGLKDNEFEIFQGDTLYNEWDKFSERNPAKKIECDIVVANPPFSQDWEHKSGLKDDFRFAGYGLAPRSTADFAFLLHGFHFLKNSGTMAIILPHGVLFRGGEEGNIRKKLIDDNNIDTIIGMPSNLFYSTGIPVCIIVLKKCKKEDDILFINADKQYKKGKNRNILEEEHINKIIDTYKNREEENNFSKRVKKEQIIENDYNLNISRYVSTAVEDKIIDLNIVKRDLDDIESKIKIAKEKCNSFIKDLELPESIKDIFLP